RSLTTPPKSRSTISGVVIATPSSDSALGALESVYACQAIATRNAPSPSSDTQRPVNSSRKSRLANRLRLDAIVRGRHRLNRARHLLGAFLAVALRSLRQIVHEEPRLHRVREVEALAQLAAEIAQTGELLVEFDALGYDLERERAAERHDGAGEIRRLAGGLGPQEGAIHLDDVDREAAEIAERGVAGAEVVHRD